MGVRQCICAYKWAREGRGTGEQNHTVSMETSWEAGLGARGGWLSDFILGEMALRGRCKLLCDLSGRERKREKEQKTSFLKKGT